MLSLRYHHITFRTVFQKIKYKRLTNLIFFLFTFNRHGESTVRKVSKRIYSFTNHFCFTNPKPTTGFSVTRHCGTLSGIVCNVWINVHHRSICLTRIRVISLVSWTGNHGSFMICIMLVGKQQ